MGERRWYERKEGANWYERRETVNERRGEVVRGECGASAKSYERGE